MLHFLGFLLLLRGTLGYVEITQGVSGADCGGKKCAEYATCVKNTCKCTIGTHTFGNGYIHCHEEGDSYVHVINDPALHTYDGEHADLAIPCRYSLTEITTELHDVMFPGKLIGNCGLSIRPFHNKNKGKIVVAGYDAGIALVLNNGTTWAFSVRKTGNAVWGVYSYKINATNNVDWYNVDGPFLDDQIDIADPSTGIQLTECGTNQMYNFAFIDVKSCGISIRFRAHDGDAGRHQLYVPGISLIVRKANAAKGVNDNASVALFPGAEENFGLTLKKLIPGSTPTINVINRAFQSVIPQNNPLPNEICNEVGYALKNNCTGFQLKQVYISCSWILSSPKFVRCFDTSQHGVPMLKLFQSCLHTICGINECASIIRTIMDTGCHLRDIDNISLKHFIQRNYC